MAPEEPGRAPTVWELYRLLVKIDERMDRQDERYVSLAVFQAFQVSTVDAQRAIALAQSDERAAAKETHTQLAADIKATRAAAERDNKAQDERAEKIEEQAREQRQRVWLAVGVASLAAVLSLATALILRAIG